MNFINRLFTAAVTVARADNHFKKYAFSILFFSTSRVGWRTRPMTSPPIRRQMRLWRAGTLAMFWSQSLTTWWRSAPWCLCSSSPASTPSYTRGNPTLLRTDIHLYPCRSGFYFIHHREKCGNTDITFIGWTFLSQILQLYFPALSCYPPAHRCPLVMPCHYR